jgi:stage III sporulation protein SpoIIIAA
MSNQRITDNLDSLLGVLPPEISQALSELGKNADLIEIILDLGRVPTARYTDEEVELSEDEVTKGEIKYVVERIGKFDGDKRDWRALSIGSRQYGIERAILSALPAG